MTYGTLFLTLLVDYSFRSFSHQHQQADMDSFCRRMVREQPTLDRKNIIDAFLAQFSHLNIDRKAA